MQPTVHMKHAMLKQVQAYVYGAHMVMERRMLRVLDKSLLLARLAILIHIACVPTRCAIIATPRRAVTVSHSKTGHNCWLAGGCRRDGASRLRHRAASLAAIVRAMIAGASKQYEQKHTSQALTACTHGDMTAGRPVAAGMRHAAEGRVAEYVTGGQAADVPVSSAAPCKIRQNGFPAPAQPAAEHLSTLLYKP